MKPQHGVVAYERPECAQVFFLFAGLGEMLMMNPIEFLKETGLTNRNVVLFKGNDEASYERGISDTIRSFEAIVEWQREFLAIRPHLIEVYAAGTSAGGAAALRCGHDLGARAAWGFGTRVPKAAVIPHLRTQIQVLTGARSHADARERFRALPAEWKAEFFDCRENVDRVLDQPGLRTLIDRLSNWNGVTTYRSYYCNRSPVDEYVARALEQVPHLTVHRIEQPLDMDVPEFDTGHNVLRPLQYQGELSTIFPPYRGAGTTNAASSSSA
jgi:hypothetical protein